MSALQFLNKKSWHTATIRNNEKVWLREQAAEKERKRIEELQKQMEEERRIQQLQKLEEQSGRVNPDELARRKRIGWMYDEAPLTADKQLEKEREDVLLGRKEIDLDKLNAEKNEEEEEVNKGPVLVDVENKMREDPLMAMRMRQAREDTLAGIEIDLKRKNKLEKEREKRERRERKERKRLRELAELEKLEREHGRKRGRFERGSHDDEVMKEAKNGREGRKDGVRGNSDRQYEDGGERRSFDNYRSMEDLKEIEQQRNTPKKRDDRREPRNDVFEDTADKEMHYRPRKSYRESELDIGRKNASNEPSNTSPRRDDEDDYKHRSSYRNRDNDVEPWRRDDACYDGYEGKYWRDGRVERRRYRSRRFGRRRSDDYERFTYSSHSKRESRRQKGRSRRDRYEGDRSF